MITALLAAHAMALLLEVCTETAAGAARAVRAGAGRIELCARLDLDGLTPETAELRATLAAVDVPVHAMIRPRAGGFVHTEAELRTMEQAIEQALEAGAHGLVLGALRADGALDLVALARLLRAASHAPVTFHRAFDVVHDPATALEQLVDLGIPRLLTSGGPPTAWEGRAALRELVAQAGERLVVMPGGGVRADHARELAKATLARELHGSIAFRL